MAKESVATLTQLEPRVLAPGHGRPMTGERTADAVRRFSEESSARTRRGEVRTFLV